MRYTNKKKYKQLLAAFGILLALSAIVLAAVIPNVGITKDIGAISFVPQQAAIIKEQQSSTNVVFSLMLNKVNNTGADAFVWINYGNDSPFFHNGVVDSIVVKTGELSGLVSIPYSAGSSSSLSLSFVPPTGLTLSGEVDFTILTIPTIVDYKVTASTSSIIEGNKITYTLSSVDSAGNPSPFDRAAPTTIRMLVNSVDALYLDKSELVFEIPADKNTASVELFVRSHIGEQWNRNMGRFLNITPNNVLYTLVGALPKVVVKDNQDIAKATFKRVDGKSTTKPGKWTAFELTFNNLIPDTVYADLLTFERFTSVNGETKGKIQVAPNLGNCTSVVEQRSQWINEGEMSIKFSSPIPYGLSFNNGIIDPKIVTQIEPYQLSVIQPQGIYEGETLLIGVKSDELIASYNDVNPTVKLIATGSLIPGGSQTYEISMTNQDQGVAETIQIPLHIGEQNYGLQRFEVQAQTGISTLNETVIVKDSTNIAYVNLEFLNSSDTQYLLKPAGRHIEIKGTIDSSISVVRTNTTANDVMIPIYSSFDSKEDSQFVVIQPGDSTFIYNFAIPATRTGITFFYVKKDGPDGIYGKTSPFATLKSYINENLIPVVLSTKGEKPYEYDVTAEMDESITIHAFTSRAVREETLIPLSVDKRYIGNVSQIQIADGELHGDLTFTLPKDITRENDIVTEIKVASSLGDAFSEPDTPITVTIKGLKKLKINAIASKETVDIGELFTVHFESDTVKHYLNVFDGGTGSFEIMAHIENIAAIGGSGQQAFIMTYDANSKTYRSGNSIGMTVESNDQEYQPAEFITFSYIQNSPILRVGKKATVKVRPSGPIPASIAKVIENPVDTDYGIEGKTFDVVVNTDKTEMNEGTFAIISFSDTQYIENQLTLDTKIYFTPGTPIARKTFKYKSIPKYQGKRGFTVTLSSQVDFQSIDSPVFIGVIDDPMMTATLGSSLGINNVRMGTTDGYKVAFNQEVDTEGTLKLNTTGSNWYNGTFNNGSTTVNLVKGGTNIIIPVNFNQQPNQTEFIGQQTLTVSVDTESAKHAGITSTPWHVNLLPGSDIPATLIAEPTTIHDNGSFKLTYTIPQINQSGKPIILKTIVPKEYFINVPTGIIETRINVGSNTGSTSVTVTNRLTELALASSFKVIPIPNPVPGIINATSNEKTIKTQQGNALLAFEKHSDRTFRGQVFNYILKSSKPMAKDAEFKITYDNSVWGGTGIEILTMKKDSNMVIGNLKASQPAAEGTYLTISPDSVIEPFALGENSKLEVIVLNDVPKFEWIAGAKSSTIDEGKSTTLTIKYVGGGESIVNGSDIEIPLVLSGNTPPQIYTIPSKFILPKGSKSNSEIQIEINVNLPQAIDPDYTLNIGLFKDVKKYYITDLDLEPYVLTIKDKTPPSTFTEDIGFTNIAKVEIPSSQRVLKQIAVDEENATIDLTVSGKGLVANQDIIIYDELGEVLPFVNKKYKLIGKKKIQVEFKTHSQKTFETRDVTLTITNAVSESGSRLTLNRYTKKAIITYMNISPKAANDFCQIAFEDIQKNSFYKINPIANDNPTLYASGGALSSMMINGVRKMDSTDSFLPSVTFDFEGNKVRFYVSEESKNITVDLTEYKQWHSSHALFVVDYELLQANGGRANAKIELIIGEPTTRGAILPIRSDALVEATGQGTGFTSVPKMYGVYYDAIKDPDFKKPRKVSLKSLTKIPRGQSVEEIDLSMGQASLMYDKKKLSEHYKQGKYLKEFIDEKGNQLNRLGVNINSKHKINNISTELSFTSAVVVPPFIDTQIVIPFFDDADSAPSYILDKNGMIGYKLKGSYLGNKPKVYIQYSTTSLSNVTRIKNIKLSTLSKYTNRMNQKITLSPSESVTKNSYLWLKMPKTMPKDANARIDLYIDSGTAFGVYKNFPLKEILTIAPGPTPVVTE